MEQNGNEASAKRKRINFDKREKQIFCSILKETDGGEVWKIINEGTATMLGRKSQHFLIVQLEKIVT